MHFSTQSAVWSLVAPFAPQCVSVTYPVHSPLARPRRARAGGQHGRPRRRKTERLACETSSARGSTRDRQDNAPRINRSAGDDVARGPAARGAARSWRSKSSSASAMPSPSGTWASTEPQGSTISACPCEARPGPWWPTCAGRQHVGQVLDGARAQQDLPVVLAGPLGERGRHGQHARAARAPSGGTARGSAGRSRSRARSRPTRCRPPPRSSPGQHGARLLEVLHARQVDVEQVDLAVDGERLRRPARAAPRCCSTRVSPATRSGRLPSSSVSAMPRGQRRHARDPGAVERLRLGHGLALAAQEREVLGQRDEARAARGRLLDQALGRARGSRSTSAVEVIWTTAARTRVTREARFARRRAPAPSSRAVGGGVAHRVRLAVLPAAEREHRALAAARPPRVADLAAVEDQQVGGARPALVRHDGHELLLDLRRVVALRDAQAVRDAQHVRVDRDAFRHARRRGRARRSRSCGRCRAASRARPCARGTLAAVPLHERAGAADEALRLRAEEAGRADDLLQLLRRAPPPARPASG